MGTIARLPDRESAKRKPSSAAAGRGELVAMKHVDLDSVIETVRVLRTLGNQSFLDRFNRIEVAARTSTIG
jgi:hypothetical protein